LEGVLKVAQRFGSKGINVAFPGGYEVSIYLEPTAAAASLDSEEATGREPSSRPGVRPAPGQFLPNRSRATASERAKSWRARDSHPQSHAQPLVPPLNSIFEEKTLAIPVVTAKETLNSISEEMALVQSPSAPHDATVMHLAEAAGLDLYVAEMALNDTEGDANEALTLLLDAAEQFDVAQKEVARRQAAEDATAAGWAAKESKDKELLRVKQAADAQNRAKQMAASKAAKEAKAQADRQRHKAADETAEEKAKAKPTPAPTPTPTSAPTPHSTPATRAQQQHIDSHAQKEQHVRVSVSGQKTQPMTKAFRKAPKASASAPPKEPQSTATDPGPSAAK
jgi:hypothetical protein